MSLSDDPIKEAGDFSQKRELRRNFKSSEGLYCRVGPLKDVSVVEKLRAELTQRYGELHKCEAAENGDLLIHFTQTQSLVDFITSVYKNQSPVNPFLAPDFKSDYPPFVIKIINSHRNGQKNAQKKGPAPFFGGAPPLPGFAPQFQPQYMAQYPPAFPQQFGQGPAHAPHHRPNRNRNFHGGFNGPAPVPQYQKVNDTPFKTLKEINGNPEAFKALEQSKKKTILYGLVERKLAELPELKGKLNPDTSKKICNLLNDPSLLSEEELLNALNNEESFKSLALEALEI